MCNVSERREVELVVEMAIDVLDYRVQSPLVFRLTAARRGQRLSAAVDDAALGEIVGRHLDGHLVAGENADVVLTHLSGNMGGHDVTSLQLHAESSVRQSLDDFAFHLNRIFFRHPLPVAPEKAANSARKAPIASSFQGVENKGLSAPAVYRETSALNSCRGIGLLPNERK